MKWIVDRIENHIAVCEMENGKTIDVINLSVDKTETKDRKEKIDKLMNDLFK